MKKIIILLFVLINILEAAAPNKNLITYSKNGDISLSIIPFYTKESGDIYQPIVLLRNKKLENIKILKIKITKNPLVVDPHFDLV